MSKTTTGLIAFGVVGFIAVSSLGLVAVVMMASQPNATTKQAVKQEAVAPSRPEPTRPAATVVPVPDRPGEGRYFHVSDVWEVFDTDRVQWEQKFKGNYVDIPLNVMDEITKDTNGYCVHRGDYNARYSKPVYLRESDAKRLSSVLKEAREFAVKYQGLGSGRPPTKPPAGTPIPEIGKLRLRVLVGEEYNTLTFTDGHLVPAD